jgi:hypothetical protein
MNLSSLHLYNDADSFWPLAIYKWDPRVEVFLQFQFFQRSPTLLNPTMEGSVVQKGEPVN